jgi:hypothetical protein
MPAISRLFEVRPRALWISAPPPSSRYAVSSRRVYLVLNPRIAAAEISLRRLARTSERTSMRCSSRPLIVTKSNLCLPNLIFGRVVWTSQFARTGHFNQLCAYTACWRPISAQLPAHSSAFCSRRFRCRLATIQQRCVPARFPDSHRFARD